MKRLVNPRRKLTIDQILFPKGIHGFTRGKRYSLRMLCEDCFEEVTELQATLQVPPPFEPGAFDCETLGFVDTRHHPDGLQAYIVYWYH